MRSPMLKAVAMVIAAFAVAVSAALVAATLVGDANPALVVLVGMGQLVIVGWWPVLVGLLWVEEMGGWKEGERPLQSGWLWGGVTILVSLGLEAEALATRAAGLQELVALCVGMAVLLVLLVALWVAGRPVAYTRKGLEGRAPFQPAWNTSWHSGHKTRPSF